MKIVITGASGFLGKAFSKILLKQNKEVYGFTRGEKEGFITVSSYLNMPIVDDAILVHLAQSRNTSTIYNKSEIDLCRSLVSREWSHIVYASSAAVYGDRHRFAHIPEETVYPYNDYTKMKIECEQIFTTAGATCLRFSNLYGIDMSGHTVVADILRQIPGKGSVKLKDTTSIRDFLWIEDGAECLAAACSVKVGTILNSGSGKPIAVGELARQALSIAEEQMRTIVSNKGDSASNSCLTLDISKTLSLLPWSPKTDLHNGLSKLLKNKQC